MGFKDLFIALTAITASLSEATSMLPRTRAVVDNINDETVVCSTGAPFDESSLSPNSLFRDAAPGMHTDKVQYNTDEDKSTAAGLLGALKDIADELKKEQNNIPNGTCKKLSNMIGRDQMQTLTDIKEFIIKHHDKEKDDDNDELEEESDNDGNKSDDDTKTTPSPLRLGVLATATAATVGSMAGNLRGEKT